MGRMLGQALPWLRILKPRPRVRRWKLSGACAGIGLRLTGGQTAIWRRFASTVGRSRGDGTQGCSCFAAPDCGSTQKCPLGLGGEPKADGTNDCNCIIYEQMKKGTQTPKAKASGMGTSGGQSGSYKVTWTGGLPPYTCKLTVSGGRTTRKTVQTEENKCSISFSCTTKNSSAKACSKLRYPYCVGDNTCNYSATVTDSTGSSISFNITAAGNET